VDPRRKLPSGEDSPSPPPPDFVKAAADRFLVCFYCTMAMGVLFQICVLTLTR
jgi:hypothetical protein